MLQYLNKLGDGLIKVWRKRWFVLQNGRMSYFSKPGAAERKGFIELAGYMVELLEDERLLKQLHREGELCLFQLTHSDPGRRTYVFAAESEQDLVEWCECALVQRVVCGVLPLPLSLTGWLCHSAGWTGACLRCSAK